MTPRRHQDIRDLVDRHRALPPNLAALLDRITDPDLRDLEDARRNLDLAAAMLLDKHDLNTLTVGHGIELALAFDAVHEALEAVVEVLHRAARKAR